METQIQILFKSDNIFFLIKILDNTHFLFTYNRNKIKIDKKGFLSLDKLFMTFFVIKLL